MKARTLKAIGLVSIVTLLAGIVRLLQQRDILPHRANGPFDLPKHSLKDAFKQVKSALGNKNLSMLAAGVAYFSTLAFFPTLAAFVSIMALILTPDQVNSMIQGVESYMPAELATLVNDQLQKLVTKDTTNLIAAVVAIALALWGASAGVQNLIKATNISYDVDESRNFVVQKLLSIGIVAAGIVLGAIMLGLIITQVGWLVSLGVPGWLASAFPVLRWVLIVTIAGTALAAFYRFGPNRKNPRWQWVSWGAAAAILVWMLGTLLFFFYAQNFGSFANSYGIFAGIVILMTWLNLSAFIVLLGAEVNHRLERQVIGSTTS